MGTGLRSKCHAYFPDDIPEVAEDYAVSQGHFVGKGSGVEENLL